MSIFFLHFIHWWGKKAAEIAAWAQDSNAFSCSIAEACRYLSSTNDFALPRQGQTEVLWTYRAILRRETLMHTFRELPPHTTLVLANPKKLLNSEVENTSCHTTHYPFCQKSFISCLFSFFFSPIRCLDGR